VCAVIAAALLCVCCCCSNAYYVYAALAAAMLTLCVVLLLQQCSLCAVKTAVEQLPIAWQYLPILHAVMALYTYGISHGPTYGPMMHIDVQTHVRHLPVLRW
jgi:hypothetical protein